MKGGEKAGMQACLPSMAALTLMSPGQDRVEDRAGTLRKIRMSMLVA